MRCKASVGQCIQRRAFNRVAPRFSMLESENAELRMKLKTTSSTHVEIETELAKVLDEEYGKLGQKTGKCNALLAKVGKHHTELPTLRDVPYLTDMLQGSELNVALDV